MSTPKSLRVLFLLLILLAVVLAYQDRSVAAPDWDRPLRVVIHPFNSDGSQAVDDYIQALDAADFSALEDYFRIHARRHGMALSLPFQFELGARIEQAPPVPTAALEGWEKLKWALGLRWWHWRLDSGEIEPDIVVIARYQQAPSRSIDLESIGMESPRLALVTQVAHPGMREINLFKLAHELLHTVGVRDHYDLATRQPIWPEGYADPGRSPRFPQAVAELMAGRIPLSPARAREAGALGQTTIGRTTAAEIGWIGRTPDS
jgi:hypothetical protein